MHEGKGGKVMNINEYDVIRGWAYWPITQVYCDGHLTHTTVKPIMLDNRNKQIKRKDVKIV